MSNHKPQAEDITPEDTVTTAAPPRCRHLRSKQFYMNLPFHSSGTDSDERWKPCWCSKTHQVFGPDGEVASALDCTAERECFESDGF